MPIRQQVRGLIQSTAAFSRNPLSAAKKVVVIDLAYDGKPPKIARLPLFLTLDQAIAVLAGTSKSKIVRNRARREILDALRVGELRLDGFYVRCMPLKKKRAQQLRLKAEARLQAMRIWTDEREKTVSDVAKLIGSKEKFFGVAERTIKAWVNNLKPE